MPTQPFDATQNTLWPSQNPGENLATLIPIHFREIQLNVVRKFSSTAQVVPSLP